MAGEARTTAFILGSATVMIGKPADLYNMTPDLHSIGLVKNLAVSAAPTYLDLTQGTQATIVYQVLSGNPVTATCEVFEYTSKNMAYALGIEGIGVISPTGSFSLLAPIVGSTTTPVVSLAFGGASAPPVFPAGSWFSIQDPVNTDHVQYVRSTADSTTSTTTATVTLDPLTAFLTGNNFPAGAIVTPVNAFDVGNKKDQPFHSIMTTSIMPDGGKPVSIIFPKCRVTRGFSMTFGDTAYGNMPFQFTPLELVPADLFYTDFHNHGVGKLFTRA